MAVYTFTCREVIDGEQGDTVGAANDLQAATQIACAYFVAKQATSSSTVYAVNVFEGSDSVATIGKSSLAAEPS
jgi:hypothetical protein